VRLLTSVVVVLVSLSAAVAEASVSRSPEQRLEALLRAHPFAVVPEFEGMSGVGRNPHVEATCRRGGYLAGVGPDYRCDIRVSRAAETFHCLALFHDGAINCRSEKVNCPRYSAPSSRSGVTRFRLRTEGWSFSYPHRFSLYHCIGQGFGTASTAPNYDEVGVSNFNARAGYFGSTWPRKDRWPRKGVFLIIGAYSTPVAIGPQPNTHLPLSLSGFRHLPDFANIRPGVAREVWSHGNRYLVQIYIGPSATLSDRTALKSVLRSLRI
jgi:hypothetical protein